jgi:Fe-S-cluster containining protein
VQIASGDSALIQIVDAALAEAARRSGPWLVCRMGCTQCCIGPFPINQLDARRLRRGLAELQAVEPERAGRVRDRARLAITRMSNDFPGDVATGLLDCEQDEERFSAFANDEACPALDPETGACDLYSTRPMVCRTFGPPVRCGSEAVGVCELCFQGASNAEIADCEVECDPEDLEPKLLEELEKTNGVSGHTIIAFCLVS